MINFKNIDINPKIKHLITQYYAKTVAASLPLGNINA